MGWILRIIREIKTVGLKDWWWFVVVLRRDEFNTTGMFEYGRNSGCSLSEWCIKISKERDRAHRIDNALSDLKINCI